VAKSWSWQSIIRKSFTLKDWINLTDSHDDLEDRAIGLVFSGVVERKLEKEIARRFVALKGSKYKELFGTNGTLIGFLSKIRVAYALGIFGEKTFSDLNKIREIRNVFAHTLHPVKFSNRRIAQHCKSLKLADGDLVPLLSFLGWLPDDYFSVPKRERKPLPPLSPRQRFIVTCAVLELALGVYVQPPKRPRRPKPSKASFDLC
jgi:hypothetical protein